MARSSFVSVYLHLCSKLWLCLRAACAAGFLVSTHLVSPQVVGFLEQVT